MRVIQAISKYKGELVYVFSNAYSMALSIVANLVATAFIEPEDMGVLQSVLLVSAYLSFLHFGVYNGLNRNLAYYKAKNEHDKVQDMVNTTYSVSYAVASVGAIVGVIIGFYYLIIGKPLVYLLASLLLTINLFFTPLANALDTTFRSGQEFKRLGNIKNIETTIYALLSLLAIILGYIGKVISDSFKSVISYVMRAFKAPYRRTGFGSKDSLILLIKTGFPMLISGYIWTVFVSCDQTYIATYLSKTEMGLYSLSRYVITAVTVIPTAVNILLYPKAASQYAQTDNPHGLWGIWKKSILIYIALLVPVCLILYSLLPILVETFMPKYIGGIKAAQYSLLTCMTFISFGPSVIFGTLRRNTSYIVVLAVSVVLFWAIALLGSQYLQSIESVSLLRFAISLLQMIAIMIITYKYVRK